MKSHLLILIFLFSGSFTLSSGQRNTGTKVIDILNADQVSYDRKIKDAQRLKGNVALRHDNTIMYCDSALLFSKEHRFHAYGHIHVKRGDTLNLFGDSLHYFATGRLCKMWQNIRLVEKDLQLVTDSIQFDGKEGKIWYNGGAVITNAASGDKLVSRKGVYYSSTKTIYFSEKVDLTGKDYTLTSDSLEYHTLTEISRFHGSTVIRSDESTIYCERGWFDQKNEISMFRQNVFIHNKEHILKGDSILYDKMTGAGDAYGNVEINDTLNDFLVNSQRAIYNEKTNYFLVTGKPTITKIIKDDTLFVYADTIEAQQDTINSKSWLKAFHHVKFYKKDIQGKCDSLSYTESDSLMRMLGKPFLWNKENQISADTIILKTKKDEIFYADLIRNAFVIAEADTVGYNQVKGRNMRVLFKKNEMYKATVTGNGQTIYFVGETVKDNSQKKYKGMNKTDCSDMLILFSENAPSKITFITQPESVFYPMNKINPKDKHLKDFNWNTADRPDSKLGIYPNE